MEDNDHDNVRKSFSDGSAEKVEAFDLLEESWFFENLFNRRSRMLRCYSDPSTSSNFSQDVSEKDSGRQSSASEKKFQDEGSAHCGLIRAPSLPSCIGKEEKVQERKSKLNRQLSLQASTSTTTTTCTEKKQEIQEKKPDRKSRLSGEPSRRNLLRTPSLPTSMRRKEVIQGNENDDISMSTLIREALANSPVTLPPRHSPNKAITRTCSMQRCRPPRNPEAETVNGNNGVQIQETRRRYSNQKTLQKCLSDVASVKLQGVNMLPGLQENKIEELKQNRARTPYLSEALIAQSRAPPIPYWVSKNSAEDMKAHLKCWAKAVGTNVRQEC